MPDNRKPKPGLITIFGASGRLGGPLARHVRAHAPAVKLRLISSSPKKGAELEGAFPDAQIMVANFLDESSMTAALDGSDGVFLVTPNFLDEERAMPIFARAAIAARSVSHVVRLLGDPPGMTLDRVPASIRDFRPHGPATQHLLAKTILSQSGLPMTYINCAAYMMDNFLATPAQMLREQHELIVPVDRLNAFIDPRDVGAVAACLLLTDNHRHIGQIYHLDNGHDVLRFSEVAALMTQIFGVTIGYDGSKERFLRELGDRYRTVMGHERAPDYMVDVFEYERANEVTWRRSDVVEMIIGRKPTTLANWLTEHRDRFFPRAA
ncbi:NmrA family NAD(P)-binding protein [Sphingopyxis sp.]|uniref:NmrA family NAD(P)-binding protein n=1 Tax=Sphingopyxis sp. TaxID=1908224 RepID=UPI002FC5E31E